MKLSRNAAGELVFQLDEDERNVIVGMLEEYPMLSTAFQSVTQETEDERTKEMQELLKESLGESKRGNKRELDKFLAVSFTRLAEGEDEWQWVLTREQASWLLQIINDVSVGHWHAAGCPDEDRGKDWDLTDENIRHLMCIDLCHMLQSALLRLLRAEPEGEGKGEGDED